MSTDLTTTAPQPLASTPEPSVALMLQTFIEKGITPESVGAFSQLCALKERMDARDAERQFAAAFVRLQTEMPKIEPTRGIPGKNGAIKFSYAPFEEIMRKVRPLLTAHGFTITFDSDFVDGRVTVICKLQHVAGHKTETKHAARVGSGPINSSEAQADGAAQTYAKRYALCSALNIVIEHDTDGVPGDDARNIGGPITEAQADTLRYLCDETKSDHGKFLAFAEAKTFEEIATSRYEDLVATLNRRKAAK